MDTHFPVSSAMATINVTCTGCHFDYWEFIVKFHSKDDLCYEFLREHGVLPVGVECPECHTPCKLQSDRRVWYCGRYRKLPKKKRSKQCHFSVSDFKGTFLEGSHLPAWQLVLFCNHWLLKQWDHATVLECLKWSPNTSVDCRSFCSEVTLDWLKNQQPIGGDYQHRHHQFFLAAGRLYTPQSTRQQTLPAAAVPVEDTDIWDTRVDEPQPGPSSSH